MMDDIVTRNRFLQKEVEKLSALLQLSERKRSNQKVLYDKNLENLHEKLADFENVLLKERKEIQQILQKKDQQIKVREDLTKTLQSKLDSQYCRQCGYPTSKNKFDTDWEIEVSGEDKKAIRKLPPLSLPLPEILPNVTFSNRLSHSKSKLSPVAEECEVASSSYLRNIHADQNPDRFHAVLTASLECLQIDSAKKNITPESEYPEEILGTPGMSDPGGPNERPCDNKLLNPRKLELSDSLEDIPEYPHYQPPRPSIIIESCSTEDVSETEKPSVSGGEQISEYANELALSIFELVYTSFRKRKGERRQLKEKKVANTCLDLFSSNLAFGILNRMKPDIDAFEKSPTTPRTSIDESDVGDGDGDGDGHGTDDFCSSSLINGDEMYDDQEDSITPTNDSKFSDSKFSFESDKLAEVRVTTNSFTNGDESSDITLLDPLSEKPRSYSRPSTSSPETPKPNYSRVSTMVVPLVDQAITVAKTLVRRRSSTNFLAIEDGSNDAESTENPTDTCELESTEVVSENLPYNRRTLIDLIDQAVEQVIPTVNCSKDSESNGKDSESSLVNLSSDSELNRANASNVNCSKDDESNVNCSKDDESNVNCSKINKSNTEENESNVNFSTNNELGVNCSNGSELNTDCSIESESNANVNGPGTNGVFEKDYTDTFEKHCNGGSLFCDDDPNLLDDGGGSLSSTLVAETNTTDNCNKENTNETNKSKKKKNKKKKKKKKGSVSDACNRLPETVDPTTACARLNDNVELPVIKDDGDDAMDVSFDSTDVVTSSLNNSASELISFEPDENSDHDKFSLAVDQSFHEMEASRGSTPDTLDGFL